MKSIFRNKKVLLSLALILVLAATFFVIQSNRAAEGVQYQTEAARMGDITTSVEADGRVRSYQSATYVWKTGGVIEVVNFQVGDTVAKGDLLASLEKASLPSELIQAEADLIYAKQALEDLLGSSGTEAANAAIALREAQEAYDDAVNYRELLENEVEYDVFAGWKRLSTPFGNFRIPKIDNIRYYPDEEKKHEAEQDIILQQALLDDAQREYNRLKDGAEKRDIEAAEARVLAAQTTLEQARLSTTFPGTITSANVQVGDKVEAGDTAFRVDDLSSLLIDLDVSEIDINNISIGQSVEVNFEAITNKTYNGTVIDIALTSSTSMGGTGYDVTVELVDADEAVRPGMTADIFIQIREVKNTLLIPNQAIRMLNGERVIYILRGEDDLVAIPIRLGVKNESYSQVVSGNINAGDLVVLDPPPLVEE